MSLERFIPRRARAMSGGPPLVRFNPAPESALPLMPWGTPAPGAAVELRALLTRIPADRGLPPTLLSVHTLGGCLDQPLEGRVGPRGEYRLEFVPRLGADGRRVILDSFLFAPVAHQAPERECAGAGPEIELDPDVPRRIDPPMEPEEGGALVLQITARLGGGREEGQ